MGNRHWRIIEERLLVDRSPYARVFERDLQLPDGEIIREWVRVYVPPFAIIFAVLDDTANNGTGPLVPFVEQYRGGISAYTLELPAGHLEDGEEALIAAQRELREEAGIAATHWQFMGKYVMDANRECGWAHTFLARGARQVAAPNHGDLGEMTMRLLTLDEVRQALSNGEYLSAPTALCVGLALNALG